MSAPIVIKESVDELLQMERAIIGFKVKSCTPPRTDLGPYVNDMRVATYDALTPIFHDAEIPTKLFRMIWYDAGRTLEIGLPAVALEAALATKPFKICTEDSTAIELEPAPFVTRVHKTSVKDDINYGQIKVTSSCTLSDAQVENSVKHAFMMKTGIKVVKCTLRSDKDLGFAIGYYHTQLDPLTLPRGDEFMIRVATINLAHGMDAQFLPSQTLANKLGICETCCRPNHRYKYWCICFRDADGKIIKNPKPTFNYEAKKRNHLNAIDRIRKKQKAAAAAATN